MADLISKFHSLGGDTIAEHKKLFNQFQHHLQTTLPEHVDQFLKNLQPKSRQEENFRVLLFIKFGTLEHILRILLMDGDKISTRLLLKKCKNLIDTFNRFSGDQFANLVCPQLSCVTRNCLIYKLGFLLDEANGEDFYLSICDKYGLKSATPLLIACSENFIRSTISKFKINLTDRQLIALHKKFANLLEHYFEACECDFSTYNRLARHLYLNDVQTFRKLLKYGEPQFGKTSMGLFLTTFQNEILENRESYDFIKGKYMKLFWTQEECKLYLQNLFPESKRNFSVNNLEDALQAFPKAERLQIVSDTFRELYGANMDYTKYDMPIDLFALSDQRKYMKNIGQYDIEVIKLKINTTQEYWKRSDLLIDLLETCRIYESMFGLSDVLRYFLERHINEEIVVQEKFLNELICKFDLILFTDEFWRIIDEILAHFKIQGNNYIHESEFLLARIHIQLIKKLDFTEELKRYLVLQRASWNVLRAYPHFEKAVLMRCLDIAPTVILNLESELAVQYMSSIDEWNKRNSHDQISYYKYPQYLIAYFKHEQGLKQKHGFYSTKHTIKHILSYKPKCAQEESARASIVETYLENYPDTFTEDLYLWFLKHHPTNLQKHINLIVVPNYDFYYELSKMHYHSIYQKFKQHTATANFEESLPFLTYEDDFIDMAEKYKPTKQNFIETDSSLKLKKQILVSMKHIPKTEKGLELLMAFCAKHYLGCALESFYYALYHSRQPFVEAIILQLIDKAVSIRKHAILLSTDLGSSKFAIDILTKFAKTEQNASLRKLILKRTLKMLLTEQSKIYCDLMKMQIQIFQPDKYELIVLFRKIDVVPTIFISEFIPLIWSHLKQYEDIEKYGILNSIKLKTVNLLPNEFCKEAILDSTKAAMKNPQYTRDWYKFLFNYLLSQHSTLEERAEASFKTFSQQSPTLQQMYLFTDFICNTIIQDRPDLELQILKLFETHVDHRHFPYKMLELHLLIKTTNLYLNLVVPNDYDELAHLFLGLLSDLVKGIGPYVLEFFKTFAKDFLNKVFFKFSGDHNENFLKLAETMLLLDSSDGARLFILGLLPSSYSDDDLYCRYKTVIDNINDTSSRVVNIYALNLLRNI